jgi:hypothetical protein
VAITNEQLAELLVGIAKSQQAVIDAIAQHLGQQGPAFRMGSLIPSLQAAANIRGNPPPQPTLQDLPSRVLLQIQGVRRPGVPPLEEWIANELGRILKG